MPSDPGHRMLAHTARHGRFQTRKAEEASPYDHADCIKGGYMVDTNVNPQRLIIPGLAGFYRSLAPYSYAFMRFALGAIIVPHGVQKVFLSPISRYSENIAGRGLPFSE